MTPKDVENSSERCSRQSFAIRLKGCFIGWQRWLALLSLLSM
jgi:hypothetical protein